MAGNLPFTPVTPAVQVATVPPGTPTSPITPMPGPATGTAGAVSTSVPSISYATSPSGCFAPAEVKGTATGLFAGQGPRYLVGQFSPPAKSCNASLQNTPASMCQLSIAGLPSGNGPVAGMLTPANAALTTCNIGYAGSLLALPAVVGLFPVTLDFVTPASITFSGAPGSTVSIQSPLVFNKSEAKPIGNGTAIVVVQTGVGTCTATYQLPPASAFPQTCNAITSALNVAIQVVDTDLTAPNVTVQVGSTNGDTEVFTLPQISPGVYRLTQLPIERGGLTVLPGNGRIDIPAPNAASAFRAVTIDLTIKYTDVSTPNGSNVVRQTTLRLAP